MSTQKKQQCTKCQKDVLMHEKAVAPYGEIYHVDCFRCGKCKRKLSPNGTEKLIEIYYCKSDYEILIKDEKKEEKIEKKEEEIDKKEVKIEQPKIEEFVKPISSKPLPEPKKFPVKNEKFKELNDSNIWVYPSVYNISSQHNLYQAKTISKTDFQIFDKPKKLNNGWMSNFNSQDTIEFLEMELYMEYLYLELKICENMYSGAIKRIQLGNSKNLPNWITVYETIPYISSTPRLFTCPLTIRKAIRLIRIEFQFNDIFDKQNYQISSVSLLKGEKLYQIHPLKCSQIKDFSDMKFIVRNQEFPFHKMILSLKLTIKPSDIKDLYQIDMEPKEFNLFYQYIYSTEYIYDSLEHFHIFKSIYSLFNLTIKEEKLKNEKEEKK